MPDEMDMVQDRICATEEALIRQAATAGMELEENGSCHYCGEDTKPGCRWCNSDCRDMWQARMNAEKRRGR